MHNFEGHADDLNQPGSFRVFAGHLPKPGRLTRQPECPWPEFLSDCPSQEGAPLLLPITALLTNGLHAT